jgi:hypothetical protein
MSSLLTATRRYIRENIKNGMSLILETWDLASSFVSLGSTIQNSREYLQVALRNDKEFYNDVIITFSLKVSGMS